MIPSLTYSEVASGRAPKLVTCEGCSSEYVYFVERSVIGSGTSLLFLDNAGAQSRAEARANEDLAERLRNACEVVPCPNCGHVQSHMLNRALSQRYGWMGTAAIGGIALGAVAFVVGGLAGRIAKQTNSTASRIVAVLALLVACVGLLAAIVLPILKRRWERLFDPNGIDVEIRKQIGRRNSISAEEFARLNQLRKVEERQATSLPRYPGSH